MKSVETNTAVLEQMQRFQNLRIPRIPFSDEATCGFRFQMKLSRMLIVKARLA